MGRRRCFQFGSSKWSLALAELSPCPWISSCAEVLHLPNFAATATPSISSQLQHWMQKMQGSQALRWRRLAFGVWVHMFSTVVRMIKARPDNPGLRSYESPAQYEQKKPQYEFARQQGAYNCVVKLRCSKGGTTLPPSSMVWSPFQSPNGHAIQCFQTTWNYR